MVSYNSAIRVIIHVYIYIIGTKEHIKGIEKQYVDGVFTPEFLLENTSIQKENIVPVNSTGTV